MLTSVDRKRHHARRFQPCLESLERRDLLTTCTVDTLLDQAMPNSLRYCMTQIPQGVDVIDFAAPVRGTIFLQSVLPDIVGPVEIRGPGSDLLSVERQTGTGFYRIFTIPPSAQVVTISGLTIANGHLKPGAGNGGGIVNQAALTLIGVVMQNNRVDSNSGGAVSSSGTAAVTIVGSVFLGNRAASGGGLANSLTSTAVVVFSAFSGNIAVNTNDLGQGGAGGAVWNSGPLTIEDSGFYTNIASDELGAFGPSNGGAIASGTDRDTTVYIRRSEFYLNEAIGFIQAEGGAISHGGGIMDISDCVFGDHPDVPGGLPGNKARSTLVDFGIDGRGGAIFSGGTMIVRRTEFHRNDTSGPNVKNPIQGGGGAIYRDITAFEIDVLTVLDSTFSNNMSRTDGGAIYNQGRLELGHSNIVNNRARRGGAIYNTIGGTGRQLNIQNSTISENTATGGQTAGGIHNEASEFFDSLVDLVSATIHDNRAVSAADTAANLIVQGTAQRTATIRYRNTIISVPDTNPRANCRISGGGGVLNSQGYNISSDATCNLTAVGDQPSTDPRLNPLAYNGGPLAPYFFTHSLQAGSPAINAGDPMNPPSQFDQRGNPFLRVVGGRIDVGAFECQVGECGLGANPADNESHEVDLTVIRSLIIPDDMTRQRKDRLDWLFTERLEERLRARQ